MMLKKILFLLLLTVSTHSFAEPAAAPQGPGYLTLSPAQPTQDKTKVEVIEFFWYGCPHCYALEPLLNQWLKTLPKNVTFIRQPAMFWSGSESHAKAYFIAEALNMVDKVHTDLFDAIQTKKQKLESEEELGKFFAAHGVKEAAFHEAYKSFGVDTKVRQAKSLPPRYNITGVPTMIVNGKYVTSGSQAGSHENMLKVLNQLIAQESKAIPAK
jgi:protein dithiol oxidoreductase (disulfide-forming)